VHAKHDYNPVKTAYPIDSIPEFDEGEYPDSESNLERDTEASKVNFDQTRVEEDLALVEKSRQSAFHQTEYIQPQAYHSQGYEPTSTELETTISWSLLVTCGVVLLIGILIFLGIVSVALLEMTP